MTPTSAPSGLKLTEEQVAELASARFGHVGVADINMLCADWRTFRAERDEKDAEITRLKEENDQLVEQRAELRNMVERSAGNAAHWQREKQIILDRERGFSDRATAAEAETTRLRAVVEKLRAGLNSILSEARLLYQNSERTGKWSI